jgi:hypothetical protein
MITAQVSSYLNKTMSNPNLDSLSTRAWALFFKSPDTGFYLAYDSKNPAETYSAIHKSHPNYEFIGMRPCDSQATAIDYAKALRLTTQILEWIKRHEELNAVVQ